VKRKLISWRLQLNRCCENDYSATSRSDLEMQWEINCQTSAVAFSAFIISEYPVIVMVIVISRDTFIIVHYVLWSGGRSVGIVRSRTQTMEFSFLCSLIPCFSNIHFNITVSTKTKSLPLKFLMKSHDIFHACCMSTGPSLREEFCPLGYNSLQSVESKPEFPKIILPPSYIIRE
jgi:hypothetical protein